MNTVRVEIISKTSTQRVSVGLTLNVPSELHDALNSREQAPAKLQEWLNYLLERADLLRYATIELSE